MLDALSRLPRTVWLIGLISLVNDSASEMLYPLVPLYLSSVLMAGPRALGIIEGVAEATASFLKLFSGALVDGTRKCKPWVVTGYALAAFGRPLMAFAGSWGALLVIRFADRIGKGLRTSPRDALLAGSVDPTQRGLAFGLHQALDNAGAVVGPLLAFHLLASGVQLRDVFLWSIVPAVICVMLALSLKEAAHVSDTPRSGFNWRISQLPRSLKRYLAVVALFTLGNSSNMFLLMRARELGTPEAHIPLLWAAVSAVAMVFSTPLSAWSDEVGRFRILLGGYATYGAFYLEMGLIAVDGWGLYAFFGFYGLFLAATEGVEKALVADLAPVERRGAAFGWFNLIAGMVLLPASVLFGWLYEKFGPLPAFGFSAACAFSAAVLLWRWVRSS